MESGTLVKLRFHSDGATVLFSDLLYDRQAEASSLGVKGTLMGNN